MAQGIQAIGQFDNCTLYTGIETGYCPDNRWDQYFIHTDLQFAMFTGICKNVSQDARLHQRIGHSRLKFTRLTTYVPCRHHEGQARGAPQSPVSVQLAGCDHQIKETDKEQEFGFMAVLL